MIIYIITYMIIYKISDIYIYINHIYIAYRYCTHVWAIPDPLL